MPSVITALISTLTFSTLVVAQLSDYSTCPSFLTPKSYTCPPAATATPSPYSAGYIPIVNGNQCAVPPGTIATDGCDDVCLLVGCCNGWQTGTTPSTVTLPDGNVVNCANVNCGNVCRMACDRVNTAEGCNSVCSTLTSGTAYVFGRPGVCGISINTVNPSCPTHVGFGFEVSPGIFLFGSVENGPGSASTLGGSTVIGGNDNGFWMTTGTQAEMLATFNDPAGTCFHGTLQVSPYTQYKTYVVQNPIVCTATSIAENLYGQGYFVFFNNCLNAVYNVLSAYGVVFTGGAAGPSFEWCPGSWFNVLPSNNWAGPFSIPSGSSVTATVCQSTVAPSCGTPTPETASCAGLNFAGCTGVAPTCIQMALDLSQCPIPCSMANPCLSGAQCNDGESCWLYYE